MSAQKYIIAVGFVVAVLLTINTKTADGSSYYAVANKSHDLIIGYRVPGDRLVLRQNVVKSSSLWRIVTEEKTFNTTRNERITLVQALDQKTDGNGADASILKGGPGYTTVTIRFKSQRNHGINFVMEVYAHP